MRMVVKIFRFKILIRVTYDMVLCCKACLQRYFRDIRYFQLIQIDIPGFFALFRLRTFLYMTNPSIRSNEHNDTC